MDTLTLATVKPPYIGIKDCLPFPCSEKWVWTSRAPLLICSANLGFLRGGNREVLWSCLECNLQADMLDGVWHSHVPNSAGRSACWQMDGGGPGGWNLNLLAWADNRLRGGWIITIYMHSFSYTWQFLILLYVYNFGENFLDSTNV